MIVFSIDPGLMSGVALLNVPDEGQISVMGSWELAVEETEDCAFEMTKTYAPHDLHVVLERFTITPETGKKSQAGWSLELIGSITYICRKAQINPPVLQMPVDAKNFVPNARLKNLGIWHRGGAGHALDALRHGVLYAVKNGYRDPRLISE